METKKPKCKLKGTDGNVFALAARVRAALLKANMDDKADEVQHRLLKCWSYHEALAMFAEYVDIC